MDQRVIIIKIELGRTSSDVTFLVPIGSKYVIYTCH